MELLKKLMIEKWVGRVLALALAALGGFLVKQGLDQAVVTDWINATSALVIAALPIVIGLILNWVQHQTALFTLPPFIGKK
jgi:hypothetical protein